MSMMMPPDPNAAGGLPLPPGGGAPDQGLPPRGMTPAGPMPAGGGMDALAAALGGGAGAPPDLGGGPPDMGGGPPDMGGGPPDLGPPPDDGGLGDLAGAAGAGQSLQDMSPIDHIKAAMKHLMMAVAGDQNDERGAGVLKGMSALQSILGGEQKKQAAMGPGPVGG